MEIRCPNSCAQIFEGIPNCFIGEIDARDLLPRSAVLSQADHPPVELIYEVTDRVSNRPSIEVDSATLKKAIETACDQYAADIAPERIDERFQDYLTEDMGLDVEAARDLFQNEGIVPFLTLERIFVSEPHSSISFDFQCDGEEYLGEYGFSFDLTGDRVEFVTPRALMPEGSYPASRRK